jgi:hypothetical protein
MVIVPLGGSGRLFVLHAGVFDARFRGRCATLALAYQRQNAPGATSALRAAAEAMVYCKQAAGRVLRVGKRRLYARFGQGIAGADYHGTRGQAPTGRLRH